jgi:hypothetical protein
MDNICKKCNKLFKNNKYLQNHQNKYPDCASYNYTCINCKYNTNILTHYNKHLSTKIHMNKHNICFVCLKEFRDKYDYNRHLNKKNKCVASIDQDAEPSNTTNNNNGIINNGTMLNVTVNDMSGKHPSEIVTQFLTIEPHLYKGAIHNQLRNLKSENTRPFLDPVPVSSFNDTIKQILKDDNHDYISRCILDADEVELEDTLIYKVNNKIELMRKNKLLKKIYPIKELTRINSASRYTFKYKLVFTPELLTDEEIEDRKEDIQAWKEENHIILNQYLIELIQDALTKTYMNPKNRSTHSLCELNNNVYCKLNNTKVQLLTNDVFADLFRCRSEIDSIIYSNFNKYMIEEIKYDLDILYDIIKSELEKLLDIY